MFVSIGLLIAGLLQPSLFKNKKSGLPYTRKQLSLVFSLMTIFSFILFGIVTPTPEIKAEQKELVKNTNEVKEVKASEPIETVVKVVSIVENANVMRQRFNEFFTEAGSKLRVGSLKIKSGEVNDVAQYMINKLIGITCTINKTDKSVSEIVLIAQGDGSMQSGVNILVAAGGVIHATNPDLQPEQRGDILKKIGLMGDNVDIKKLNGKTVKNNVEYQGYYNEQIGIMFSAFPVK
jgi:hypothetical protein